MTIFSTRLPLRLILAAAVLTAAAASAMPPLQPRRNAGPTYTATVTDIDYRDDLARLTVELHGRPHTSGRIDSVTVEVAPAAKDGCSTACRLTATDIDGVDFRRYFQFEDDGLIPVEIDFPPLTPAVVKTITLHTVHGPVTTTTTR